ncbi:MAG: hypothetical protein KDA92_22270, partial [Planctomycetales bacterium]|nr:hypothetical protein [Planctomycetales bacterium]
MRRHRQKRDVTRRWLTAGIEPLEARLPLAQISGVVWNDVNHDGRRGKSEDEMRAPDIVVRLLDENEHELKVTTTDVDGAFDFQGVYVGEYQLEFIPTDDVDFTEPNVGGDGKDSDVIPGTGKTAKFQVFSDSDQLEDIDAGLYLTNGTETVSGSVWNDINGDGIRSANEPPLNGVEVQLEHYAGGKLLETLTDSAGRFQFLATHVLPGDYRLDFRRPDFPDDQWEISPRHANPDLDRQLLSDADPINGKTKIFSVAANSGSDLPDGPTFYAGFFHSATIAGQIWHDLNRNGQREIGEVGAHQRVVELLDAAGNILNTAETNSTGEYRFVVMPGVYQLAVEFPDSLAISPPNSGDDLTDSDFLTASSSPGDNITRATTAQFTVLNALDRATYDLGVYAPYGAHDVRGRVWTDENANGLQDTNEQQAFPTTVYLEANGQNVIAATATDSHGNYRFDGQTLLPGNYNVAIRLASVSRTGISPRNISGGQTTIDSDAHPVTGKTPPFALDAGTPLEPRSVVQRDIGMFTYASVSGQIWNDSSHDGVFDANEDTLGGVQVTLHLDDGRLVARTSSASFGSYQFPRVLPGREYYVEVQSIDGTHFTTLAHSPSASPHTNVDPNTGRTPTFSVRSGEQLTFYAGVRGDDETTGFRGIVWNDLDGDGVRDDNEPGLAGLVVTA